MSEKEWERFFELMQKIVDQKSPATPGARGHQVLTEARKRSFEDTVQEFVSSFENIGE